jgi:hypothetical protein
MSSRLWRFNGVSFHHNYASYYNVLNAMTWSVTKAVRSWLDLCSDDATYYFLPWHLHFISETWTIEAKRSVNIERECVCVGEQTIEPELQRHFFSSSWLCQMIRRRFLSVLHIPQPQFLSQALRMIWPALVPTHCTQIRNYSYFGLQNNNGYENSNHL